MGKLSERVCGRVCERVRGCVRESAWKGVRERELRRCVRGRLCEGERESERVCER